MKPSDPCFGIALAEVLLSTWYFKMTRPNQKEWYVVFSKPHKEEFAQFHLRLKGLETFFPRLMLPEFSHKNKRIVPLFPNYLFVHINLTLNYDQVRWAPGVKTLVNFGGNPLPLDAKIAENLLQQADHDGIIAAQSDLKIGQEVQIRGGPFDGVLGVIQRTPDAKGRVRLLMKLLSRRISVEVPVHLIAGGWVANGPRTVDANLVANRPDISVSL
jgi:transcription elongation factor/antiterminator RfaH